MSWAETHAAEVAKARAEGLTTARLAERFGKSIPTIRQSLRYAALADESVKQLPKKMPRPRWHEAHAAEVAELKAKGMSTMEIARRFGLSDTTIRKALDHARHLAQNEGGDMADDS